ncbi:double-strand break repair protein AddB [Sphingomonas profundi]|uniref:double-strand break repair protein AddB n=1 Tax=Alterirhizorhabdus profundi TaxID=2681549 RepID=UPI001E5B5E58|nr:double-strand break repair protein AddB [Sphingomonas profundi]
MAEAGADERRDEGAGAPRLALYTIPPHRAFADALAAGLIARAGKDPLALARGLVLLPNNRAITALRDAFVRRAAGGLLLPRMAAIGDPELDERLGSLLDPIGADDIPPAIDPLERQFVLARLVAEARVRAGEPVGAAEAVRLAADLARTLDQLVTEDVDPRRLTRVVDPAIEPLLSAHWQASLAVLETILVAWPGELAARGRIDLAERRNRLLDRAAQAWRAAPPQGFVVAAGIAVSAPSAGRLLRTIAALPAGMVVFAGLDLAMPDAEWDALGPHVATTEGARAKPAIETHPQYLPKRMLDAIGAGRREVLPWPWRGGRSAPAARTRVIGHAMAPAAFTARWSDLPPGERRLAGVRVAELAGPAEEAQAIAIAMRGALEQPARTVALVTPDRDLARRVVAHLGRWGIAADDSAGRPLSATPPGTLLIGLAEAAAEGFAPVPLLALLKHPLSAQGEARLAWLDGVRRLDLALRGPRPPAGLAGISAALAGGEDRTRRLRAAAEAWWAEARALLAPLEAAFSGRATLADLIAALREAADRLAGDAAWAGPAGRAAAELIAGVEAAAGEGPAAVRGEDVAAILRQLMDGVAVRPPAGDHPRVFVWGLIEARLQRADLTILGGLNEGVWPGLPPTDPWLAPRIRADLGLPGVERRIGVAAHDFAQGLGGAEVLVTRARRGAAGPAIASRLWLRLAAMTGGLPREPRLAAWARLLDHPAAVTPADRPAPAPPSEDRPRRIAVTRLDRLKADPFAFYADTMLRLARLDAVDADPSAAWRGNAVHAVFERWMKQDGCDPAKLEARARAMLAEIVAHPVLKALWTPRLMEAIDFTARTVAGNLAEGRRPLTAEIFGEVRAGDVALYGKIDRIDRLADGGLAIIDYKTGKPPGRSQVAAGYAMQLGLLGLIAEGGGFRDADGQPYGGTPAVFEYWSMAAAKGRLGHVTSPAGLNKRGEGIAEEDFVGHAARILADAAATWLTGDAPFTAKLHPEHAPYGDYDQLMRLEEWYGRGD